MDYVRDARKAGLNDGQIEKNAQRAGWKATEVKDAIARMNASPAEAAPKSAPPASMPAPAKPVAQGSTGESNPSASEKYRDRGVPDDYVIGAGDTIAISVWKEPDASVQNTVVRPDGKISMPLLKEVSVVGLTPAQLEKAITKDLSKFITAPDVTVLITGIQSKKIYVTGAVKKEGPIPYTYRMTVLQAISEAGGPTDYAKRKKMYVLHNENGRQFTFPFDYDAVLRGQHMELNIYLTPGDTVVVPH